MENLISEENIGTDSVKIIMQKMSECVCHINKGDGFFSKIPYNSKLIPVLIINNNVLSERDIIDNKTIKIYINNKKESRSIKLDYQRKIYTNQKLKLTIIEIKQKDNINDYLEFDDEIIDFIKSSNKNIKDITNNLNKKIIDAKKAIGFFFEIIYQHKNKSSILPILSHINYKIIGINIFPNNYNKEDYLLNSILEFNNLNLKKFNEIVIVYRINKGDRIIQLFSQKFIENNKDKCKIIIDGEEQEIYQYYDINKKSIKNNLIIILKEIKTITDMSYMFCYKEGETCKALISLPNISELNTINITNMEGMFYGCSSLSSLPDISNWNIMNVKNISNMFSFCSSLLFLPDISKWNTNNVIYMNSLFEGCSSLSSLPDISKWDTSNVQDMNGLFYGCKNLLSLPDISKWDTSNVNNISFIFANCEKILSLPDISKWNTSNANNMSFMFFKCSSLSSLPDISKWNTSNVNNMSFMFAFSNLSYLPDISKWNTNKVIYKNYMIKGCSKLMLLPHSLKRAFFKSL